MRKERVVINLWVHSIGGTRESIFTSALGDFDRLPELKMIFWTWEHRPIFQNSYTYYKIILIDRSTKTVIIQKRLSMTEEWVNKFNSREQEEQLVGSLFTRLGFQVKYPDMVET